jgi:von willebrand factor type A domain protein
MKKHWMTGVGLLLGGVLGAAPATVTLKVEPAQAVLAADTNQQAQVRISISAPSWPAAGEKERPRVNLAIALDRSGSMAGMRKLENAKQAAKSALNMLSERDRFALIVYDDVAKVLVPSTPVTEENRRRISEQIDAISPGSCTALFAGVSLAAAELSKLRAESGWVNRLLLLSDGLANVGPSSPSELGRLGGGLVKERISVSTVGVGGDYNEDLMTALAQNSDGNFYFVENSRDLSLIFEKELGSALAVAAQGVTVRIICPEGVKPRGILGHECRIDGQAVELKFNQIYAGHDKVLILQLEVPPQPVAEKVEIAEVKLEYLTANAGAAVHLARNVQVGFSANRETVEKSVNQEVSADVALQKSAVLREAAVEAADAGDFARAKRQLQQAHHELASKARATGNQEVAAAAAKLADESRKMEQAPAAPAQYKQLRKELKGRAYQERNRQSFRQ